jgi:radical SAM superfamily enzyme YgiQ (UPF0313 family)
MKKVLLIFPSLGTENKKPDRPPLGLLTVAGPLLDSGVQVTLLDERAEDNFDHKLLKELGKNPVCVGISSMSGHQIASGLRISKLVKANATVPVVWGGVQASLEPRSTIAHAMVDIIVRDDGEETFPRLIDALDNKNLTLDQIAGIAFKRNGKIIFTDPPQPADINKLPMVPFHLIDFNKYESDPRDDWAVDPKMIIPIETSRGCPYSCIFCTESVRKKKWRALSPERVIHDLKHYLHTYGIRNFTFIDDNLFGNIRRGEKIVELLAREELDISWYTNIRTDYMAKADPAFITMLEKSGCKMLTFGAESGSKRILKMINKKATPGDVIAANRKLTGSTIIPHFVTIRGFPTETRENLKETLLLNSRLLLENRRAVCDSPCLIATPSTKIAEMCLGDQVKNFTLEDWSKILDLFKDQKPPWVLDDTYELIDSHRVFCAITSITNRSSHIPNFLYRLLLRIYRLNFRFGFGERLSRLLEICMKKFKLS